MERTPRTLPDGKTIAPKLNLRLIGGIAGGLLIIGFLVWGTQRLLQNSPSASPEPTHIFQSTATFASSLSTTIASQPAKTSTPSLTRTAMPLTQTATPPSSTLGIGSTMISEKDSATLLYVPAGEFTMGDGGDGESDTRPGHTVRLDAFWIDKTEVTNKMYSLCVTVRACQPPPNTNSNARPSYYGNAAYDNFPVIYMDWNMAKNYCEWADRRLPTESEWEKAARGTDGRIYPWGNDRPQRNLLSYYRSDTTEVGQYPNGASPYGVLDLAGNVREWVADWYSATYYASSPTSNPSGPDSGIFRVLRGSSWNEANTYNTSSPEWWGDTFDAIISSRRIRGYDYENSFNVGFRCAMSATP